MLIDANAINEITLCTIMQRKRDDWRFINESFDRPLWNPLENLQQATDLQFKLMLIKRWHINIQIEPKTIMCAVGNVKWPEIRASCELKLEAGRESTALAFVTTAAIGTAYLRLHTIILKQRLLKP